MWLHHPFIHMYAASPATASESIQQQALLSWMDPSWWQLTTMTMHEPDQTACPLPCPCVIVVITNLWINVLPG